MEGEILRKGSYSSAGQIWVIAHQHYTSMLQDIIQNLQNAVTLHLPNGGMWP